MPSLLERLDDDEVVLSDLDALRLSPKELAIALRDDVTEADGTDERIKASAGHRTDLWT